MRIARLFATCITAIVALTPAPAVPSKTFDGYTFVFSGNKAFLYDMDSSIVHTWNCPRNIEGWADLLRDSSIIVPSKSTISSIDGQVVLLYGGRLQIIDWNGKVTWDYTYASSTYLPHHDAEPVYRTNDPREKPTFLLVCATAWGDKITELKPRGSSDADVVWEWMASDHTCQSDCTDKTEVLDVTKGGIGSFGMGSNNSVDYMHTNSISYNRFLDQIVISAKGYNEMMVIDHSTTTAQAKGTTGGRYGKGGSILYRWGNPQTYGATGSAQFNGQHHCCWVPDTLLGTCLAVPGGGNFMAVDNGGRRVIEIECPGEKNGVYPRSAGQPFAPARPLWKYTPYGLQSNEGSIQKMPNGNYIICTGGANISGGGFGKNQNGSKGSTVYEVNAAGSILWQLSGFGTSCEGYRYPYGYLGGGATPVKKTATPETSGKLRITTAASGQVKITLENRTPIATLSLYSLDGRQIPNAATPLTDNGWLLGNTLPGGLYLAQISSGTSVIRERVSITH